MKKGIMGTGLVAVVTSLAGNVLAAEAAHEAAAAGGKALEGGKVYFSVCVLSAALCMALAVIGAGSAQGRTADRALEGIARQPEATKDLQLNMILGLSFIESLFILAFVICILIIMVNPFKDYFVG